MLVYDFEIFMYDWLVVFKDLSTSQYKIIINDVDDLKKYVNDNIDKMFVGYNNKQFDDIILSGIFSGIEPYTTMTALMNIENKYSVYKSLGIKQLPLVSIDLMQDVLGMSLKQAEGYMNLSVDECSIPFDIDRKLTEEEIDEVVKYCTHDVDSTAELLSFRDGYVKAKLDIIKMFKLPITNISKTNAGLCATVLDARYQKHDDELKYDMPDTVVINNPLYRRILDLYNVPELDYTKTMKINIAGIDHTLAYGGIHAAIKNFKYDGEMWHIDVRSYYPSLMIRYNYHSRNIKDPQKFIDIYNNRIKAKKEGNKVVANALKLIVNTTYGCMKSKYSQLYDPKMANQVCITGQLLLVDLIEKLEPYCKLVQSNTDGIIVIPYNKDKIKEVVKEWEDRTGMSMEIDVSNKIYQKDVNNYIIKNDNDEIEVKGSYVGQYNSKALRNNVRILDKCVVKYLLDGVKPETTIASETDIFAFQYITKSGSSYNSTVWVKNGKDIPVNNVNRVYSSKCTEDGTLVKIKSNNLLERRDSIANLPDHCIVDNNKELAINDIDKSWYVEQAYKRINDFLE